MVEERVGAPVPQEGPFIRTSVRLARVIAALAATVALAFATSAVALNAVLPEASRTGLLLEDILAWATGALAYSAVGVAVAWRRSANAIGWLFLLIGLAGTSGLLGVAYAGYALATGATGGAIAAWYSTLELAVGSGLIIDVFVLLFPTGKVPSRRWLPVLAVGLFGIALTTIALAVLPGPLLAAPFANPFGVPQAASIASAIGELGGASFFVGGFGAAISVVVRFVNANDVERQQLKWMAAAVFILLASAVVTLVQGGGTTAVGRAGGSLALDCIPLAAGIAILRYRLYDIDLLVNRALVYGATTATIGVAFFGGVVLLQGLLRPFTNGNEFAVALSTLGSIALFQPLRARMQRAIDRRFYRSRYDATRTLDEFSVRLRDVVELETVRGEVLAAIGGTVRPAHVSLWLRERT